MSRSYGSIVMIERDIALVWRELGRSRVILDCLSDLLVNIPAYGSDKTQLWQNSVGCGGFWIFSNTRGVAVL